MIDWFDLPELTTFIPGQGSFIEVSSVVLKSAFYYGNVITDIPSLSQLELDCPFRNWETKEVVSMIWYSY